MRSTTAAVRGRPLGTVGVGARVGVRVWGWVRAGVRVGVGDKVGVRTESDQG